MRKGGRRHAAVGGVQVHATSVCTARCYFLQLANHRLSGKGGKREEVLEVSKSMQAALVEPNVIPYDSLITACAYGEKTKPNVISYSSLITACAHAEKTKPNAIYYNSLITACAYGGKTKPNVISYNSLITACANRNKAEELDALESMQAAGLKLDVISYNSLITAHAEDAKGGTKMHTHAGGRRNAANPESSKQLG